MVAGNWKMYGSRSSVAELVEGLLQQALPANAEVAVFPPSLFLGQVLQGLEGSSIAVGAQNCAFQSGQGALTGELASTQLAEFGCSLVLVGHSERRLLLGEDDATVARKFIAAREAGLLPLLCVGETLAQREAGQTLDVVASQLDAVLRVTGVAGFAGAVVAYEPVWAIGTGLTATPEQAQTVHAAIRQQLARLSDSLGLATRILYGGSVKATNAAELFGMPDIDGGLVGGASLNANEFGAICCAAGS
jgi:triosephosphate isomerase